MDRIIIQEPRFERFPAKKEIELALETIFPEFNAIKLVKADHSRGNYVAHAQNGCNLDLICHIPNPDTNDAETAKFRNEIEIADVLGMFFADNYNRIVDKGEKYVNERNYASAFLGFTPKNEQVIYFTREKPKGTLARYMINKNIPFNERIRALYNLIQAVEYSHSEGFVLNNVHEGNVLVGKNIQIPNLRAASTHGDFNADVEAIGNVGYKLLAGKKEINPAQPEITGYSSLDFPLWLAMHRQTDIREMKKDIGRFYHRLCA